MINIKTKKSKKGLIFTATIVMLLFVIVVAVSLYSQTIDEREQRAQEKFKFLAMSQILEMVSEDEVNKFAEMSSRYALHKLINHTIIKNPLKAVGGPYDNKYTGNVNTSIFLLMTQGDVPEIYFDGGHPLKYTDDEKKYTFTEWKAQINAMCANLGYTCNILDMRDFNFKQTDAWNVNVYFNITTHVESFDGRFNRTQNITVNKTFSIEGFSDAMISRKMVEVTGNNTVRRQVFRFKDLENPKPDNVDLYYSDTAIRGKGFFYGPVADFGNYKVFDGTEILTHNRSWKYIFKSDAKHWMDHINPNPAMKNNTLESFGAFIVTSVDEMCMEYNETDPTINTGNYDIVMCQGTVWETTRNIDLECQVTCTYEICNASQCPFDCYDGYTDCEWDEGLGVVGGPDETFVCNPADPLDDETILGVFRTRYPTEYSNLCSHFDVEAILPPEIGTGTVVNPIDKPYLFFEGTDLDLSTPDEPENYPLDDEGYGSPSSLVYYLINNENDHDESADNAHLGDHELWNIQEFRDLVMCGAYVETDRGEGPSFFQRMITGAEDLYSDKYGIETFVVGKWAGGALDPDRDDSDKYCQLDRNFMNEVVSENMIKGMPGVTSFNISSTYGGPGDEDPAREIGVGHFGLNLDVIEEYNIAQITCEVDGNARCE